MKGKQSSYYRVLSLLCVLSELEDSCSPREAESGRVGVEKMSHQESLFWGKNLSTQAHTCKLRFSKTKLYCGLVFEVAHQQINHEGLIQLLSYDSTVAICTADRVLRPQGKADTKERLVKYGGGDQITEVGMTCLHRGEGGGQRAGSEGGTT